MPEFSNLTRKIFPFFFFFLFFFFLFEKKKKEREREREKFSLLLKLEFEREWINLLGLRSAASAQQRRLNEGMGRVRVAEPFDSLSRRFCNP